ncbi:uncharacterized protein LOC111881732 [Lactuca sativa]|uniref:uncharacterized protein LOC111881732 n=1 Tax=Lactuca sativa TaxID=4236 RepID=UPI000CD92C71|nr:uncharacterized protein LOC111881732 [Lactuca sativa]
MPPRKNPRHGGAAGAPPPPPLPPPQFDPSMFQAAVTAAVATTMSQISTNNAGGASNGPTNSNNGDSQGCSRECTYEDFTNAKPKTFNGSRGVAALLQWFEKTESVFEICACPEANKVKFVACTFSKRALTWWNGHVNTLTLLVANSITWEDLKTMLMKEYFPRGEIQKLEEELCGLKMTGSDILSYTSRFNDLAILCPGMVPSESKKVERYIWGLSSQLQGSVLASKPTTYDGAKELEQQLIDHKASHGTVTTTSEQAKGGNNKRKFWNKKKGQPAQDPANKQQVVAINATTTTVNPTPIRQYAGNLPKCNKCNFHHNCACREMHCTNCNKKGHTDRFCKAPVQQNAQAANPGASQT